ncbi:MAG: prolyl oligopeptidase family serine peptidase [Cyanobacteria bacterium J06639_16]
MIIPSTAQATWQDAPEPISEMLDVPWFPEVIVSPNRQWMVQLDRPTLPPIELLAQPRVQIAGIQLNPMTRGPAATSGFQSMTLQDLETGNLRPIALPEHAQIRNVQWSPQGNALAFTLTQPNGIALWVADAKTGLALDLTPPRLNGTYGQPCQWISETAGLLCKLIPEDQPAPPAAPNIPSGPRVEENLGRQTPQRTYTNLLQNPYDEALFEYYLTSVLEQVTLNGERIPIVAPQLISSARPSPDGEWFVLTTFQRPFSYQVPVSRFAQRITVMSLAGHEQFQVADLPLADDVPIAFGSVRTGRRIVRWRADRPATLYWIEALDDGDAGQPADQRDAVYQLDAPFTTNDPQRLWTTELRFRQILWGHDSLALGQEYWRNSRQLRTWQLNPAAPDTAPVLLNQRDIQDSYNNPGQPITAPGPYHRYTLLLTPDGEGLYLKGRGASPEGVYPFLDRWQLPTNEVERLWQSADPHYERVILLWNNSGEQLMTFRQSPTEPPNYWQRDLTANQAEPLTHFTDPLPWFEGVTREVVRYRRNDGVELSATLYLPPNHNPAQNGPIPTVMWVYPREFKSRDAAAQVTAAENVFSRPYGYSPLFLLTQGYALLRNPTMPIIGEGDTEPNDTYIEQLTASAQAAVNYLVELGISNPGQIAIGGHSYGAFTAANLLAYTDLFNAGIANSGAYNRTLTPFGFQGEQRTFWETPQVYIQMSPFAQAAQINEPLLLIHGEEDANSGTYPLQSERLYDALQGLGGTVRWVELPAEGHVYRSREAVSHVLWEMTHWLDTHLKN